MQQLLDIGQDVVWDRTRSLASRLRQGLAAMPGVTMRDRGRLLCGIVSWTKVNMSFWHERPLTKDVQQALPYGTFVSERHMHYVPN